MASWSACLAARTEVGSAFDVVRRRALIKLKEHTGRNVIAYYSGWLQKSEMGEQVGNNFSLNDSDKSGFMATVHKLDRSLGLDLILHTPGGDAAATESLVDYLRGMFGTDIRVVVPQLAMSAGTMIACAAKSIIMGKHSSLGPVDPQIGGLAAHGIIEEFEKARNEIMSNPATIPLWQAIVAKYPPSWIGEAQKAIDWSEEMVTDWLRTGMFASDLDANTKIETILKELGDHSVTKSHNRHISMRKAQEMGLRIEPLEDDQALQDAVLTVHHTTIQTMLGTGVVKLIENHEGVAYILQVSRAPGGRIE